MATLINWNGQKLNATAQLKAFERFECEESLAVFLERSWRYIDPAPFHNGWVIGALAEHLEAVVDGEVSRLMIHIPPRCSKSSICSVAFPAWVWLQPIDGPTSGPAVPIVSGSYAFKLSVRDSIKCRRLIKSPWYQELWGERVAIAPDNDQKIRFGNSRGGERLVTSVDGGVTGEGGNIIIIDDPNNAKEVLSDAVIETTNEDWWDGTMSTRLNDPKTGAFIVIQQRLGESDLSGHIMRKDEWPQWTHLCLPMEYEDRRSFVSSIGWKDPRRHDGELLWPERFGHKEVASIKANLGSWRCNPGEAPILMADLTQKPISTVAIGDRIIGFDRKEREDTYGRYKLTETTVMEVHSFVAPVVKMTLDSGEVIRCTRDHRWYMKDKGCDREMYLPVTLGRSSLARVCPPKMFELMTAELHVVQPTKWRDRLQSAALKANFIKQREKVLSIEPDGEETVYGLTTTTGNYVVWGLASSNSAGQLQQRPEPAGGGIIKRKHWQLWPPEGEEMNDLGQPIKPAAYPAMDYILASLDTAYTTDTLNDPSALTIWGVFSAEITGETIARNIRYGPAGSQRVYGEASQRVMLMYAWAGRLELHDLVGHVAKMCRRKAPGLFVDKLMIEAKGSGISVAQEMRRLFGGDGFGIQLSDPGRTDKVARLYSVQNIFEEGAVFAPDRSWAEEVITQCGTFPNAEHDDLVDSVSMALRHLRDIGMLTRPAERMAELDEGLNADSSRRFAPLYPG